MCDKLRYVVGVRLSTRGDENPLRSEFTLGHYSAGQGLVNKVIGDDERGYLLRVRLRTRLGKGRDSATIALPPGLFNKMSATKSAVIRSEFDLGYVQERIARVDGTAMSAVFYSECAFEHDLATIG
ncbi:hypothetical protein PGTUg99_020914 [Puccinia graminis f. sp. tritici]|uniref:Uncharacterized protein n=1 Tax=Puccinia graminis f. sp. tritici TaxID=56615 RepID=A0A5B0Q1L5_PUCGR|nr:hypothetical protein PGTUg99_020914 [Puccinia graminis f. sp. tritici]